MLHFVMSYMKQNKRRKQTLESAQYRLEISFYCICQYWVHRYLSQSTCPVQSLWADYFNPFTTKGSLFDE